MTIFENVATSFEPFTDLSITYGRGQMIRKKDFEILDDDVFTEDVASASDICNRVEPSSFDLAISPKSTSTEAEGKMTKANTCLSYNVVSKSSPSFEKIVRRTGSFDRASTEYQTIQEDTTELLSYDKMASRGRRRSSLILDWLTNPDNEFMYQGRCIDSRIFRSHSAVENRPNCNFVKSTRYHSLRKKIRETKHLETGVETDIGGDTIASKTNSKKDFCVEKLDGRVKSIVDEGTEDTTIRDMSSNDNMPLNEKSCDCYHGQWFAEILKIPFTDDYKGKSAEIVHDDVTKNQLSDEVSDEGISRDFRKLTLETNSLRTFSRNSLSNYEGKLRRINSDALFYKGALRNTDKRSSFGYRRRRSRCFSLQLQDLVNADKIIASRETGMYSFKNNNEKSCKNRTKLSEARDSTKLAEIDVNSKEFIEKIEHIFSHGSLQQIQELARYGFNFNAKDEKGNCPLHYAAIRGSDQIITEILENGGSVWIKNFENQLPVEIASNMVVRMLLSGATLFYKGQYSKEIETRLMSKAMNFEL